MDFTARPAWQIVSVVVVFIVVLCALSFLAESVELNKNLRRDDPTLESCLRSVRLAESVPKGSAERESAKAAAARDLAAMTAGMGASVLRTKYRIDTTKLSQYIQSL